MEVFMNMLRFFAVVAAMIFGLSGSEGLFAMNGDDAALGNMTTRSGKRKSPVKEVADAKTASQAPGCTLKLEEENEQLRDQVEQLNRTLKSLNRKLEKAEHNSSWCCSPTVKKILVAVGFCWLMAKPDACMNPLIAQRNKAGQLLLGAPGFHPGKVNECINALKPDIAFNLDLGICEAVCGAPVQQQCQRP